MRTADGTTPRNAAPDKAFGPVTSFDVQGYGRVAGGMRDFYVGRGFMADVSASRSLAARNNFECPTGFPASRILMF